MNKKILFTLALIFSTLSCSQEDFQEENPISDDFTVSIAEQISTRTSLGNDGKILWLAEDDISLINRTGHHTRYVVSGDVNSSYTTFSPAPNAESINLNINLESHYAIYPYSEDYTVASDLKTVNVVADWANQIYVEGTFADDKAIMTANSTNSNLSFSNAFSLIEFKFNADAPGSFEISSISVTSKDKALNGDATIDMSQEKPQLVCIGSASENMTNTLILSQHSMLDVEPSYFYLLVPAGIYGEDANNRLVVQVKGNNLDNGTSLDQTFTMSQAVECIRSTKTTLFYTFKSQFSGDAGGMN